MSAATTATTTTTAPAATWLFAVFDSTAATFGRRRGIGRHVVELVEGEHLGLRELGFGQRAGGPRQTLAGQGDQTGPVGARRDSLGRRGGVGPKTATSTARRGDRLGLAASATPATAATSDAGPLGLLVGDLGHRQIRIVVGDPPTGACPLLDAGQLDDVGELVGDLDEVGAGIAAEADDLDADTLLLDGADGRREVAVARHHDGDVEVASGLHHVDDQLDVEVRLDLAVAVLADVLADDLVVAPAQEVVEVALVLVVRVEPRVRVGAHQVAACRGRFEKRDVIDVHARGLGRIEDVRDVYEDGDVLAHDDSLGDRVRPAGAASQHGGDIHWVRRADPAAVTIRWMCGPVSPKPIRCQRA